MLYLYLYFTREQVSGMKKWKILFNIIMETVIFFGIAVLLIIGIPKLMGFCSELDTGITGNTAV